MEDVITLEMIEELTEWAKTVVPSPPVCISCGAEWGKEHKKIVNLFTGREHDCPVVRLMQDVRD